MIQIPHMSRFYEAANAGRLMSDTSDDGRLVCFKYTEATAANADWDEVTLNARGIVFERSEEHRVGKECELKCRSRWSPYH